MENVVNNTGKIERERVSKIIDGLSIIMTPTDMRKLFVSDEKHDDTIYLMDLIRYLYSDARVVLHKALDNNVNSKEKEGYFKEAEEILDRLNPKLTQKNKFRTLASLECRLHDLDILKKFYYFRHIAIGAPIIDYKLLGRDIRSYKRDSQGEFTKFIIGLFDDESIYKREINGKPIEESKRFQ